MKTRFLKCPFCGKKDIEYGLALCTSCNAIIDYEIEEDWEARAALNRLYMSELPEIGRSKAAFAWSGPLVFIGVVWWVYSPDKPIIDPLAWGFLSAGVVATSLWLLGRRLEKDAINKALNLRNSLQTSFENAEEETVSFARGERTISETHERLKK